MTQQSVRLHPRNSLTPSQELIWTSQRMHPDAPLANMAIISSLQGHIEAERFVAAVDLVISGGDALRTVVREIDGVPFPTVLSKPPLSTSVVHLDREQLAAWIKRRIAKPLDVSDCVYDSVLIIHGARDWSWFMNIHHLATDAASSALLFNSVAAAYSGDLQPLTSYAELTRTHFEERETSRWRKAAEHWTATNLPSVTISLYRPDSGPTTLAERVQVPMRGLRQQRLDALLADRFRQLSPDLSLTSTLATTIAAYLARLGNDSVVIGLPVSNRSTRLSKSVIGPLVELFPLYVEVLPDDTFATLNERTSRAIFEVLRHAQPGTSPRQAFDVVLNVHGATFGDFGEIAASTRWVHPGHIDDHHRLRVQALDYDGSGVLEIAMDINHRVADADHRRRASHHFGAVLDAMLDDPDRRIDTVGLLGASERTLLGRFTTKRPGTPIDGTAPDIVRERLAANAKTPALSEGDRVLSGAEVNEEIERAAGSLRRAGIGRGDLVALEMPLGTDVVIALHGVLRAGAAFVPIDPTYPSARREHIRTDSGARLTATSLDQLLDLESPDEALDLPAIAPDDLAYVIYTSGSTGLPKGVPITHRGLSEYLGFAHGAYIDRDAPVMPLFTSLSFDLTITTLFLPFLAGGTIRVHPEGGLAALRSIVDDASATILKATPSHLELLVHMIDEQHPLRTLIAGGEAFKSDLADRLLDTLAPGLSIYNEYGPTEAVVGCMEHLYDAANDPGPDVPIGRPAPGVNLHVLDTAGHPVPLGVVGELHLSRPGMTAGYVGRPDISNEKLITRPNTGTSDRLYRTGDLVRMLDADRMIYVGRADQQIKVGGIRLEPGEIEAAAQTVPGVRRAVAGLWTPDPDHVVELCVRCGLATDVPGVTIDAEGVCSSCHGYDRVAPQAEAWFRTENDLQIELANARANSAGDYDVLHLISGGKDSTYALHKLVEMGARVYAITLDNGFIADVAMDNVRRATNALGVDHEFVTVDAMNEIFRDSLERYSNVCNGCYKAIYTVALERAEQLGIPSIVTGLSRGQFFETRLVPGMFGANRFDPEIIDAAVIEARKVYHNTPDAVLAHMDTDFLADGAILDSISFIDFYRYVDVDLSELYESLESTGIWQRPPDSGRSTNCLINAAGIFVHKLEQGHHNYAVPYSWDVRLGHKTRNEALTELDDPMDAKELATITSMLAEVGYEPQPPEVLTLWIEAQPDIDLDDVREALRARLPEHAQPRAIEVVEAIPLTANGKVDLAELPPPAARRIVDAKSEGRLPESMTERRVASIWSTVLGLPALSASDDFFDLGGASLHALEMIVRVSDSFGIAVPESRAFQMRTVAELASEVDRLLAESSEVESFGTTIPDLAEGTSPLSHGEQALLYEWRRDPAAHRYKIGRLYRLPGGYDRQRFDRAVKTVVEHQPVLHTSYGHNREHLAIERAVRISVDGSETDDLEALAARLHEDPFDLIDGPLVTIHHLESRHDLDVGVPAILVRMHHIVSDAGSLDVFWDQLDSAYRGVQLPELRVSYAAHGAWRAAKVVDPADVWPLGAEDVPGAFSLRGQRPEDDGYVRIETKLTHDDLRNGPGTTPFANALAAFTAALAPFHSTDEFEVAITSSVRDHPDVASVVGYFHNPLPLLVRVADGETAVDLASRTSETLATSLAHRSVPFAAIVQAARTRGVVEPTARVMLAIADLAPNELDGQAVSHRVLPLGNAVNDVTIFVQIRGRELELGLEYRGSAIGRSQALDILSRFESLLRSILLHPHAELDVRGPEVSPLSGPPLMQPAALVPDRITNQIAVSPTSHAATSGDRSITYAELDSMARTLAGRLRSVGVSAGDRVAIVLPRSVDLPAAVLATWMLGASYVPIDVSQPPTRVTELVSAANVVAAVTTGEGHQGLAEVTTLHADSADPSVLPISRVHTALPEDEAYVIFTSGSTGRSKGVPITHWNLATSLGARMQWYGKPVERFLLVSSAEFDSSVAGLFWTLADGGELIIPTEDQVHNVDALIELLGALQPSHTLCVPSLYDAMLRRKGSALPGLRTVIVAGEACSVDLVRLHASLAAGIELVNEYGPTEATVWATAFRCDVTDGVQTVPIGGPIPGVTTHVVDVSDREVPVDVVGELLLSGPTVARGYMQPGQDDRFMNIDGYQMYRTGDRVVRRASGVMEFLGRVDHQLSIGGIRIEPAEVESALLGIDGIHSVVVDERDGELIAWVEAGESHGPSPYRALLAERLAPTHLPRRVIEVLNLPRNRNGKVDRSRLHELPDRTVASPRTLHRVGVDPLLDRMVEQWTKAFDGQPIDANDDFFMLGGDSLRAVRLVSILEDEFGRRVGIGELVDASTPATLVDRVRPDGEAGDSAGLPVRRSEGLVEWLRSTGTARPLVVLPPGGGNLLRYAPLIGALDPNIPVIGVRLPGADARSEIVRTIEAQAEKMLEALDGSVPSGSPYRLLGWSTGGLIAWEIARLLLERGDSVELLAHVDTYMAGVSVEPAVSPIEKYRSLFGEEGARAVFEEASGRLIERTSFAVARRRYRFARQRGRIPSMGDAERQLGPVIRSASMAYKPRFLDVPTIYFSASESPPHLTVDAWATLQSNASRFEVVRLDGVHFVPEERCIIGPDRVDTLVAELARRLDGPGPNP